MSIARRALAALVLLAVSSGVAVRIAGLRAHLDYDSANYAYVATRMTDHGERYLDRFNNKPPGIYWWYQGFFEVLGNDPVVCHATSLVPDLLVAALLFPLGRRLGSRRTGALAVALYGMLAMQARMAGFGFTESPLTLATVAAALLAVRTGMADPAVDPVRDRPHLLAVGALMGGAAIFKQPALLQLLGIGLWLAVVSPRDRRWPRILALIAGFSAVWGLLALWLARQDLLGTFVSRVFLEGAQHGYDGGFGLVDRARRIGEVIVGPMPFLLLAAGFGVIRPGNRVARGLVVAGAGPILLMCVGSYELYDHYLIPALPFLCLGAALGVTGMPRRGGPGLLLAIAGLQLLGNGVQLSGRPAPHQLPGPVDRWLEAFRPRDLSLDYQRELARWVAERTDPDEKILATGSAIPYMARRENGYRFLGVAPYLGRLDAVGFTDFGDHAAQVSILVLERWRMEMLSPEFRADLESGAAGFRPVATFDHPEYTVWERLDPRD